MASAAEQVAELDQVEERHRRHKERRDNVKAAAALKKATAGRSRTARRSVADGALPHAANTHIHPGAAGDAVDLVQHPAADDGDKDPWEQGHPRRADSLKSEEEAADHAARQEAGPGKSGYFFVTRDSQGRVKTSTQENHAPSAAAAAPPAAPGKAPSPQSLSKQASWRAERAAPTRATFSAPRKRSRAITELQSQLLQVERRFHRQVERAMKDTTKARLKAEISRPLSHAGDLHDGSHSGGGGAAGGAAGGAGDEDTFDASAELSFAAQRDGEAQLRACVRELMRSTIQLLDADRMVLYLRDDSITNPGDRRSLLNPGHKILVRPYEDTRDAPGNTQGTLGGASSADLGSLTLGQGIAGWVVKTGESVNIADAYSDSRFDPGPDERLGYLTSTVMCLPLYGRSVTAERRKKGKSPSAKGGGSPTAAAEAPAGSPSGHSVGDAASEAMGPPYGALEVDNKNHRLAFNREDEEIIRAVAEHLGMALEKCVSASTQIKILQRQESGHRLRRCSSERHVTHPPSLVLLRSLRPSSPPLRCDRWLTRAMSLLHLLLMYLVAGA